MKKNKIPIKLLKRIPAIMISVMWDAYMYEDAVFTESDWKNFVKYSDMYFKKQPEKQSSFKCGKN